MATKNNFSKAVLDLMGLPGNDNSSSERIQEVVPEVEVTQVNRMDLGIDQEKDSSVDAEIEAERKKFLYNTKTVSTTSFAPMQEDVAATVISKSMVIVGEITSSGNIDIFGDVKGSIKTDGDIKATGKIIGDLSGNSFNLNGCTVQGNIVAQGNVVIGTNTVVVGDIHAENIKLNGKVKGNLTIGKMSEFLENALLAGDVRSQTISMSQGAKLHGNVSVALDGAQSEKEFDSIFGM